MQEKISPSKSQESSPAIQFLIDTGQLKPWLYQTILPFIKGEKVLEVGSGNGDISMLFVSDSLPIRISDPDINNYRSLQQTFSNESMIKGVHRLDLNKSNFEVVAYPFLNRFDTVFSVNNVLGSSNYANLFSNAKKILKDRGRVIILLPVPTALYDESAGSFDELIDSNWHYISKLMGKTSELIAVRFFSISDAPAINFNNSFTYAPTFVSKNTSITGSVLYMILIARKITSASPI